MKREKKLKSQAVSQDFRKPTGPMNWSYHALAFFDLLGQSNALVKIDQPIIWQKMPPPGSPFAKAFKHALGGINGFRSLLGTYFNGLLDPEKRPYPPDWKSWSEPQRNLWDEIYSIPHLRFQGFSDTVLVFTDFKGLSTGSQLATVQALIVACGAIMPTSLALGVVPRGAIDIAPGIEMYKGQIYGPVLMRCYMLESKKANWPRVVVGEGLLEFLTYCTRQNIDTPEGKVIVAIAIDTLKWIAQDVDGVSYVDYLGRHAWRMMFNNQSEILRSAYDAVKNLELAFANNDKVREKYVKLIGYFDESPAIKIEVQPLQ